MPLPEYNRPKIDGWLKRFWKQKEAQLIAIGMDPELDPLGCGHYGCVFASKDPRWVIKVTRDPTEGPIAAKVTELRNKREAELSGIVLFKEIYKADETVEWRGKTWPVYVTVREAVKPFDYNDAQDMRRYKKKNRGFDPGWDPREYEFISRTALDFMKEAALKWHEANDTIREAERIGVSVHSRTQDKLDAAYNDYADWASKVGDDFPYIGETLFELLDEGLVMRDIHWANLGYTTWEGDEAKDFVWRPTGTTVIHDLGHTPTDPIEARFKPLGTFPYVPGIGIPGVPFIGLEPNVQRLGAQLATFFRRDDVWALLDVVGGDGWTAGGCYLAAAALVKWLGPPAKLWSVQWMVTEPDGTRFARWMTTHMIVALSGGVYLDAHGAFDEQGMLRKMRADVALSPGQHAEYRLGPPLEDDVAEIGGASCPVDLVNRLVAMIDMEVDRP